MRRNKHLLLSLLLPTLLSIFPLYGQSLSELQQQMKELEEKSFNLKESHPEQAMAYAYQGLELALSVGDSSLMAQFYARLGNAYENDRQWDSAMNNYQRSLEVATDMDDSYARGRAFLQLGTTLGLQDQSKEALPYFDKAKEEFSKAIEDGVGGSAYIAYISTLAERGETFSKLARHQQALDDFSEALGILDQFGENPAVEKLKGSLYSQIGAAYQRNKSHRFALDYYQKDLLIQNKFEEKSAQDSVKLSKVLTNIGNAYLQTDQLDSARYYFTRSLSISEKLQPSQTLANTYLSVGIMLMYKEELKLAKQFLHKSMKINSHSNYNEGLGQNLLALGQIEFRLGNISRADSLFRVAARLGKEKGLLQTELEARDFLSDLYAARGNYRKALKEKQQADIAIDSARKRKDRFGEIAALQEKKQMEASHLDLTNEFLEARISYNRKQKILIGLVIFFLFLSTIGFYQTIISRNKIDLIEKEKEVEFEKVRNMGAMKARTEISKELHEGVGGLLTGVSLHMEHLTNRLAEIGQSKEQEAQKAQQLLGKAIQEVRSVSHKLSDNYQEEFGLRTQVENLIEDLRVSGKNGINFQKDIDLLGIEIPETFHNDIYRITQELITNAIRHAEANNIAVFLFPEKDSSSEKLKLMVEDNGKGFDARQGKKGIGIKNIQSRLEKMGGKLDIDSCVGRGTTVLVDIPL